MKLTNDMRAYVAACETELKELIRAMSVIPAPSGKEEKRAAFCKKWFVQNGFENVTIDEALNVLAPYGVTDSNKIVVISAHTDVVFGDETALPFHEDAEKFYCPGVCDDTANLAILMIAARYFVKNRIRSKYGLLFAANSCEEGLGNLKGIRQIAKDYGSRILEHITFDGTVLNTTVTDAVGSVRYHVTVKTEGGHSFSAFGKPNAIVELSRLILDLEGIEVPQKEGTKTTRNIGTIEGGTSVNTIAQEASMLCEYRSNDKDGMAYMKAAFAAAFARAKERADVEIALVGERPCAADVDKTAWEELIARADESVRIAVEKEPVHRISSTDSNIPLSMGIPSTCIGVCEAYGIHTREENLVLASLPGGVYRALCLLSHYFEV